MLEFHPFRVERKVLEVLNQASQRIASDLDTFWSVFMHMDAEGAGHIDIAKASHFFKDLFHVSVHSIHGTVFSKKTIGSLHPAHRPPPRSLTQGVSGYELRILVAYAFMRDISKDGLVRPDELLQHLQAIPMRGPSGEELISCKGGEVRCYATLETSFT
jgi:hypothetical protein